MPNEVLKGDRRHYAYDEKLCRSVKAIQEHNAGLDDGEQFSVTSSLLHQLSCVKPGLAKKRMAEHKTDLDAYNAGDGARQNVGKLDSCSVVKWSEEVYGTYKW